MHVTARDCADWFYHEMTECLGVSGCLFAFEVEVLRVRSQTHHLVVKLANHPHLLLPYSACDLHPREARRSPSEELGIIFV